MLAVKVLEANRCKYSGTLLKKAIPKAGRSPFTSRRGSRNGCIRKNSDASVTEADEDGVKTAKLKG
jgi:hypothetical protein